MQIANNHEHLHLFANILLKYNNNLFSFVKPNYNVYLFAALDPAGPWFEHLDKGKRMKISKDDAAFVRGIHTDCR